MNRHRFKKSRVGKVQRFFSLSKLAQFFFSQQPVQKVISDSAAVGATNTHSANACVCVSVCRVD